MNISRAIDFHPISIVRIVIISSSSTEGMAYRENFPASTCGPSYFPNFCIMLTDECTCAAAIAQVPSIRA